MSTRAERVRGSGDRAHTAAAGQPAPRFIKLFLGLVLLVVALPPFLRFPWLDFWLVPVALLYLLLLLLLPRLWLIVLPLATVGLDITPFTGRFAYNELDLLFLLTIASELLFGRYRFGVFAPGAGTVALFLYLAVVVLGYSGWSFLAQPPRAETGNPYHSGVYAYKVVKGMFWGVALVPMWGYLLGVDKARAVNTLVTGFSCAALLLGLVVLWERVSLGVVLDGSAWRQQLSSLLDLTSSYRVTGLFSDMHTGGEALDGVVLLLLPVSLYAVLNGDKATWLRLLGAIAALVLAYVTLVGFTRATYASFGIALLLFSGLSLWSRHRNKIPFPLAPGAFSLALAVGLVAAVTAFRCAGSYGLACYGALALLSFAAQWSLPRWSRQLAALVLIALAVNAHLRSAWVEPSAMMALAIGLSLLASYVCASRLFEKSGITTKINRLLALAAIALLPVIVALALGGQQINARAERVAGDYLAREQHWGDVIGSAGDGFLQSLVGNGVGQFPLQYVVTYPQVTRRIGRFYIEPENDRNVLHLDGGSDLTLGQRVTIEPSTIYKVTVHLRAAQPSRLVVALCERNLIYPGGFTPNCVKKSLGFTATNGVFARHTMEINSGAVGRHGALWRWPTVMTISYANAESPLEIDAVELSVDGIGVLRNSSFRRDLDYWFSYHDYSHMPWHIKNTFLQLWFESGWLGLSLFLVMVALLVRSNFRRHSHDSLVPVYTTGVLTLCVFGVFGSPLDSARVSWIFYFFLAAGLARLRVRPGSRAARRTRL